MRRHEPPPEPVPVPVPAWDLTEGSELPGRRVVLQVRREAVGRTVDVVTDGPGRTRYAADDPVAVVRLAP